MFGFVRSFFKTEAASGIVLFTAALAAMLVANSAVAPTYISTLATPLGPYTLSAWINDGLMAIFFFVVGMEIKSELTNGSLTTIDRAALPVIGALGGMIAPALIFIAFVKGGPDLRGWGIPMATDIAFAVGVTALLGKRVPFALKVFLLALAIADDLGAVLVIALFYTAELHVAYLIAAGAVAITIFSLVKFSVRSVFLQVPLGVLMWWLVHHSGVHATIAGCILGFLVPNPRNWIKHLHFYSSFLIMPIFAFANAGLSFSGVTIESVLSDPLVSGISYGLLIGKPLGIFGGCFLAVKLGFAKLGEGVRFTQLLGVACLGGIGFTMSIFISTLALSSPASVELAKIGIVKGSILSAVLGAAILLGARGYKGSTTRVTGQ